MPKAISFGTRAEFDARLPGIYLDIPEAVYHRAPYCSKSGMQKALDESPAAVIYDRENPTAKTEATKQGNLIHTYVLREEDFSINYALFSGERRSNDKKAEWAELCEEYGENFVVRDKDYDVAVQTRERLLERPFSRQILTWPGALFEVTVLWFHEPTGLLCKSRLDIVLPTGEGWLIVDLKTARSAVKSKFSRQIAEYRYDAQAAMYIQALVYHGINVVGFGFLPVEKKGRLASAYYLITQSAIEAAWEDLQRGFDLWLRCEKSGEWPDHPEEFVTIDVPNFRTWEIRNNLSGEDEDE